MPASHLQALLFDMDGTLIDSEGVWYAGETAVMNRLGVPWNAVHQHRLLGSSLGRAGEYMAALAGGGVRPETIAEMLLAEVEHLFRGHMPVLPGVRELLDEADAAGVPCALVTSSYRVLVDAVLAGTGLEGAFEVTVAGDEVTRHKPEPECYLTVIDRLGVQPEGCVVLEDSEPGILAGEAAGCLVVGVPSLVPLAEAPGRHLAGSLAGLDLAALNALVGARTLS